MQFLFSLKFMTFFLLFYFSLSLLDLLLIPIWKKIIHSYHHLHHHLCGFFFLDLLLIPIWKKSSIPLIIFIIIYMVFSVRIWCTIPFGKNHPFLSSSSSSSIWFFLFGFGVKSHLEKIHPFLSSSSSSSSSSSI